MKGERSAGGGVAEQMRGEGWRLGEWIGRKQRPKRARSWWPWKVVLPHFGSVETAVIDHLYMV